MRVEVDATQRQGLSHLHEPTWLDGDSAWLVYHCDISHVVDPAALDVLDSVGRISRQHSRKVCVEQAGSSSPRYNLSRVCLDVVFERYILKIRLTFLGDGARCGFIAFSDFKVHFSWYWWNFLLGLDR